jgi:ABC-type lipoprotein release transport system permease subunit
MLFRIALRNIFRQRRRTLLTVLTMMGGFTLSSVSIAWMDGAYNDIINKFTRTRLGHIQIHQPEYIESRKLQRNIRRYEDVGSQLDPITQVEAWAPRVFSAGIASVNNKSAGAQITGIDPAGENAATGFDARVTEGQQLSRDAGAYEALLGRGLATRLSAKVGDELVILSQGADGSLANDLYRIVGIVESGDKMTDQSTIYLHIGDAQELLVLEGRAHEIVVVTSTPKRLFRLTDRITATIGREDLVVEPWQLFAKSFYEAMKADQNGNWISLLIIMLVVSVGVLNTVLMSVLERRREYGLLKAIGTSPRSIFRIVVTEVFVMSIGSVVIGFFVSLGLNYWLSLHGISLPDAITFAGVEFKDMYAEINVRSFVIPCAIVIVSALLVAIPPALRAARTAPAAAMRTV